MATPPIPCQTCRSGQMLPRKLFRLGSGVGQIAELLGFVVFLAFLVTLAFSIGMFAAPRETAEFLMRNQTLANIVGQIAVVGGLLNEWRAAIDINMGRFYWQGPTFYFVVILLACALCTRKRVLQCGNCGAFVPTS